MSFSSMFSGLKTFFKMNIITRLTAIMVKGGLGQKVTVILGCLFIFYGIFKAFYWILLATAGYLIVYLAFKDYERMTAASSKE